MKKTLMITALSLCSVVAIAEETISKEKMDAAHECMRKAGLEVPEHEPGKKVKVHFNEEQRAIADNCFRENGMEPPRHRMRVIEEQ